MMAFLIDNLAEAIRSSKKALREGFPITLKFSVKSRRRGGLARVCLDRELLTPVVTVKLTCNQPKGPGTKSVFVQIPSETIRDVMNKLRPKLSAGALVVEGGTQIHRRFTWCRNERKTGGNTVRTMCWLSSILVYTASFNFAQAPSPSSASTGNHPASLQPFFSANCFLCHNSQAKTAGLDLQSYVGKSS